MNIITHFLPLLTVVISAISILHAEPVDSSKYKEPVKVACLGDSITQGSGTKGNPYPKQLQALLGDKWKVGNFGKSRVFVCRPCPVIGKGGFGITEEGTQEQIPIIDKLAKDMGCDVIDMHAALVATPELIPDRVHPNALGAGKMAEAAYTELTGKKAVE